ncbi:unnamed protein product [Paramecium sonneborni]|uniref:Uncharacterized protein n=1 Tax=Paramecium sonneborni TaxID=65129 RepID=A0A8S1N286_9CILI|nr:unnamed protein product [Paramecium sonneborni]
MQNYEKEKVTDFVKIVIKKQDQRNTLHQWQRQTIKPLELMNLKQEILFCSWKIREFNFQNGYQETLAMLFIQAIFINPIQYFKFFLEDGFCCGYHGKILILKPNEYVKIQERIVANQLEEQFEVTFELHNFRQPIKIEILSGYNEEILKAIELMKNADIAIQYHNLKRKK